MNHPHVDLLRDLVRGVIPENPDLVNHIETCVTCQKIIEDLLSTSSDVPQENHQVASDHERSFGTPTSTGRFRLQAEIGRGGMGVVYSANDAELEREVAVKRLHPKFGNVDSMKRRFELEARVTGVLEHPGIAPVYSVSTDAHGRLFYAMRLLRGKNLQQKVREFYKQPGVGSHPGEPAEHTTPWTRSELRSRKELRKTAEFRSLLRCLIQVAQTIAYAHTRGFIHRDIKPGNIVLGSFGETYLVDWGLARQLQAPSEELFKQCEISLDTLHGETNAIVGSPAWMSPEQATAEQSLIDHRSDIYSLGATLFFVLTGCAPMTISEHDHSSMDEQLRHRTLMSLKDCDPSVPRPLVAICNRALAAEPSKRFASATEFALELERWLADEPLKCLPESLLEKSWRLLRKNRGVASVSCIATLAIVTLSLGYASFANYYFGEEQRARKAAVASQTKADRNQQAALESLCMNLRILAQILPASTVLNDAPAKIAQFATNQLDRLDVRDVTDQARIEPLAEIYLHLADIGRITHAEGAFTQIEQSTKNYQRALELIENGVRHFGDSEKSLSIQRNAIERLGDVALNQGRAAEAVERFEKAISLTPRSDAPVRSRHYYALLNKRGQARLRQNIVEQAIADFSESLVLSKQLWENDPSSQSLEEDIVFSLGYLSNAFHQSGDFEKALTHSEEALDRLESLRKKSPDSISIRHLSQERFTKHLTLLLDLNRLEEGRTRSEEFVEYGTATLALEPTRIPSMIALAETLRQQAIVCERMSRWEEAEKASNRAVELSRRILEPDPLNVEHQRNLAMMLDSVASVQARLGKGMEAVTSSMEAIELTKGYLSVDESNLQLSQDLAIRYERLAAALEVCGQVKEALVNSSLSFEKFHRKSEESPNTNTSLAMLRSGFQYRRYATLAGERQLVNENCRLVEEHLERRPELHSEPDRLYYLAQLEESRGGVAETPLEAAEHLSIASQKYRAILGLKPKDHAMIRTLFVSLLNEAECLTRANELAKARSRMNECELLSMQRIELASPADRNPSDRPNLILQFAKLERADGDEEAALRRLDQLPEVCRVAVVANSGPAILKELILILRNATLIRKEMNPESVEEYVECWSTIIAPHLNRFEDRETAEYHQLVEELRASKNGTNR